MKINDVLTSDELARVTARSNVRGAAMVATQWLMVAAVFAVTAAWPNPFTFIAGTVLLGGRLLGFGILGHECGHQTLFRSRWLNDFVGEWVVSPPRFGNNRAYMRGHLQHHRLAGTRNDPDLANYRDYPIPVARLKRKLMRDVTGRTGWRQVRDIARGLMNPRALSEEARAALLRGAAFNLLLLGAVTLAGAPWLYLMWVAAFVVVTPLVSRIRQVAEHAAVPDLFDPDPRNNTRTVLAGGLARLVFAPHRVNYHLEHHLVPSAPAYRLKALHELLARKGVYGGVQFPGSYVELLKTVTRPREISTAAS